MNVLDRRVVLSLSAGALVAGTMASLLATQGGVTDHPTMPGTPWMADFGRPVANGTVLTVSGPGDPVTIRSQDGGWTVDAFDGYPAAPDRVEMLLRALAGLSLSAYRTADPTLHPLLGLADDRTTVQLGRTTSQPDRTNHRTAMRVDLTRPDGTVTSILLGRRASPPYGPGVYARRPGQNQTVRLSGQIDLPDAAIGWLDTRLLDRPVEDVLALSIRPAGGGTSLRIVQQGGGFVIPDLPEDRVVAEPFRLSNTASWLERLDILSVRSDPVPDTVNQLPQADAVFGLTDGLVVQVWRLGESGPNSDTPAWARLRFTGPGEEQLNARVTGYVFRFARHKMDRLTYTIEDATRPRA